MLASIGLKILTAVPRSFGWAVRPQERPEGTGLFLQAHYLEEYWPFQHLSIKVRPKAQSLWQRRLPKLMKHRDADGLRYFTVGAGPEGDKLVQGFNRPMDISLPKVYVERLAKGPARSEDAQIARLLHWHGRFSGAQRFSPIPWPWAGGKAHNCNAYTASLLALLKVPKPSRLPHRFYLPSFKTPLALDEFGASV